MGKSRKSPALIELIHARDSAEVKLPSWWRSSKGPTRSAAPSASREASSVAGGGVDTQDPQSGGTSPPFIAFRGERVVLSFTSVTAGIAAFLAIVLVGAGFLAGQSLGVKAGKKSGFVEGRKSVGLVAHDEIDAAKRSAPNIDIYDGVGASPVKKRESRAENVASTPVRPEDALAVRVDAASPWVDGHTYIVVQVFKAEDRADAEEAKLFLKTHGVETVILDSKGGNRYVLVAVTGFNREDPAQRRLCDRFHDRIRKLGDLFVKSSGRYGLQGYQKKITGNGW